MRLSKVEYHRRCSPSNPLSKKAKTPIDRMTVRPMGVQGQKARHNWMPAYGNASTLSVRDTLILVGEKS